MGVVKKKVPLPVTDYDYYEVFARERDKSVRKRETDK